jgi:ribosomal protein L11 methyltransferase
LTSCLKMSGPRNQENNRIKAGPYQDLFIYYLKGRLKRENRMFQENFIGNWEEENDSILFFSSAANRQIEKLLHRQPQLQYVDSYQMTYQHWLGEAYSTFEHGKFRIMPPWEMTDALAGGFSDKLAIILDPGLVFGTGTHPTTRNCLEALELASRSIHFSTVLDLGTGTGLLALAAARLGSRRTVGVDLNLLAAKTAKKNVGLNQLEDRVMIARGRAEDMIAYRADLVIANIHYVVMQQLINSRGFLAKKHFILSGLMRSEANAIVNRLAGQPVEIVKQWTQDGIWHTFYGKTEQKGQA